MKHIKATVSLQLEVHIPASCNFSGDDGPGDKFARLWFDVEPKNAQAVLLAFRNAVSTIQTELGPGGRLHELRPTRKKTAKR